MRRIRERLKHDKMVSGVLLMMLHALALSVLYVVSKKLTHTLSPNQVGFLYKFAILIAILPWCCIGGIKANLKTNKFGMHFARGAFSIMASLCFLSALSHLNVLDALAISFLEPIIIILVSILFFKEQMKIGKGIFILCGLIGTLLIIKPGFQKFSIYYIYMFFALLFWAGNNITIKVLGRTERSKGQIFYVTLSSSIISLPLALQSWQPLEIWHLKYLAILAVCYIIHSAALFKAFKYADISTVMPYDYTRLVFGGIVSYVVFREIPDALSFLGYLIITLGGLCMIRFDRKHSAKRQNISIEQEIQKMGVNTD